jgi:ribokinase
MPRVVVLGAYNADLMITCETPILPGRTLVGGPMQICGGGRGGNCAVAAARAGCDVSFIGAHGRDGFGGMAKGQLASESINLDYFLEIPQVKTGTCLSLLEADSGKHFLVCANSANDYINPQMIRAARARILTADLVISELEIPKEAVWELMNLCQEEAIPFVLDISALRRLDHLPDNSSLLAVADTVEEAKAITKTSSLSEAMRKIHLSGCQNVVIIDNNREVTYLNRQESGKISVPVEYVVDRCGAAECFETWTALSLIRQVPLGQACQQAVVAMAHCLSRMGAHQGMPRRSEMLPLL